MSFFNALALPRRDDMKQSDYDRNVRYEICAASERAKVLLQTAQQVNDQLHSVRTLRRQRSSNLSESGKEWVDRAISHTSIAVSTTAHLAEPVPEDVSSRRRRLPDASFLRHLRHLISDSSQVTAQLAQLAIASQSLNTAMSILLSSESHKPNNATGPAKTNRSPAAEASLQELSELMNRRRKTNAASGPGSLSPQSRFRSSADEDSASQATTKVAGERYLSESSTSDVFDTFLIDHKLVLTIEAVEKWRKAAEEALEAATQNTSADIHKDQDSNVQPEVSDLRHTNPVSPAGISNDKRSAAKTSVPRRKPLSTQGSVPFRDSTERPSASSQSKDLDSPKDTSLRQSFEKEAVVQDQSVKPREMPPREETNSPPLPRRKRDATLSAHSINPDLPTSPPPLPWRNNSDATFSSNSMNRDFQASRNQSAVSVSTQLSQPYCRSRGRTWLEHRADSLG